MPESAESASTTGPVQRFFESQRLKIAYWDWGNPDAPPLLLVHGGRDHSRTWDRVAARFRDRFHVVAMDMRGHGDSQWAIGAQYGLPDMALDIVRMVETIGGPAAVIAHSYGGQSSIVAAATYRELFARLVVIEGVHEPNRGYRGMGPGWIREWGDRARAAEIPKMRVYPTVEDAARRLLEENPWLPPDLLPTIAGYAVKPVAGGYVWKFDGWLLNRTSMEIRRDDVPRFWSAITCPVLLISGGDSRFRIDPTSLPFESFKDMRLTVIEGAAHWVHHDHLDVFMDEVTRFFDETPARG